MFQAIPRSLKQSATPLQLSLLTRETPLLRTSGVHLSIYYLTDTPYLAAEREFS